MVNQPLVITRIFNAPRQRVWQAWTNPEHVKKWWGPEFFTSPFVEIDLRVGGKYLYCMRGSPGPGMVEQDFWSTGVYREIVPMEKLVCTDNFADKDGNIVPAKEYGMGDDWPEELLVTIELEDAGEGKTKMTVTHTGIPDGDMSDMTAAGWNGSFDKLAASFT